MSEALSEALLSYAHLSAVLAVVVFITSEAVLCRSEWLNAAAVRRLVRVDLIYLLAALAVLATGLARTAWGFKGGQWYWHQPLLHLKLTMFVVIGLMSIKPTLAFRRWVRQLEHDGSLPPADEVRRTRLWIMVQAHLMMLVPLAATLLARGVWAR